MSERKDKAPQGGEALTEELKAALAFLERAKSLGVMADLTAMVEEKAHADMIVRANGAVQKAVHVLNETVAEFNLEDTALYVEWDRGGKVSFRFPTNRRRNIGGGGGRITLYNGELYQSSKALAKALKVNIPLTWEYGAATYMNRKHKGCPLCGAIEFEVVTKADAAALIKDKKAVFVNGVDFLAG